MESSHHLLGHLLLHLGLTGAVIAVLHSFLDVDRALRAVAAFLFGDALQQRVEVLDNARIGPGTICIALKRGTVIQFNYSLLLSFSVNSICSFNLLLQRIRLRPSEMKSTGVAS